MWTNPTTGEVFMRGVSVNVSAARLAGLRGQAWRFDKHVRNLNTGTEWIDVFDKDGSGRSFKVEEVTLKIIKPKRKYVRRK